MAKEQQTTHDEPSVKSNAAEATRLYQRGVSAARGGQRRIAAGLLTRSVQLDPNNAGGWLWLSGVIDDPHQIAFCLNAVLKLDPGNERARKGLRWLEERQLLKGAPTPSPLLHVEVGTQPTQHTSAEQHDSWWVGWRQWHRDMRSTRLLMWSIPLVILFLSLVLHRAFHNDLTPAQPRPTMPSMPAVPTAIAAMSEPLLIPSVGSFLPTEPLQPTPMPIVNGSSASIRTGNAVAYLNALQPIRTNLRHAVDSYRETTGQPGTTAIGHTSAAQQLRSSVEHAHTTLSTLNPPDELRPMHNDYLHGLELELEAIDAINNFYGSYETAQANLAALRFQEANTYFARARAGFDTRLQDIRVSSAVSSHTAR